MPAATTEQDVHVSVTLTFPLKRLRDLLVSAFEGGSNYWYQIPENGYRLADGLTFDDFREGGKCQPEGDYYHWAQLIPSTPGCTLLIDDREDGNMGRRELNLEAMKKGIQIMASEQWFHHFKDFMEENDDATTGDVYLQLCIFGDVIYG